MQEARVRSLSQEDPTCLGGAKPVHRSSWVCAPEPVSRSSWNRAPPALARRREGPRDEKPCTAAGAPLTATREQPEQQGDPATNKIKKKKKKKEKK